VLPAKSVKIPIKTREAIGKVVTRLRYIPETVTTFYNGKLSIWGQTCLKLEQLLQLAHSHELGRFNCKRLRGGDIAIIYDVEVHWRSRYYKKLNRAKSAAVFTFSHCNLNRTASGYTVRLPHSHGLSTDREASLRTIALRYSNLFDDVGDDADYTEEPDEEEESEDPAAIERQAQELIQGKGKWQDELS
jgi:hypothetical protein